MKIKSFYSITLISMLLLIFVFDSCKKAVPSGDGDDTEQGSDDTEDPTPVSDSDCQDGTATCTFSVDSFEFFNKGETTPVFTITGEELLNSDPNEKNRKLLFVHGGRLSAMSASPPDDSLNNNLSFRLESPKYNQPNAQAYYYFAENGFAVVPIYLESRCDTLQDTTANACQNYMIPDDLGNAPYYILPDNSHGGCSREGFNCGQAAIIFHATISGFGIYNYNQSGLFIYRYMTVPDTSLKPGIVKLPPTFNENQEATFSAEQDHYETPNIPAKEDTFHLEENTPAEIPIKTGGYGKFVFTKKKVNNTTNKEEDTVYQFYIGDYTGSLANSRLYQKNPDGFINDLEAAININGDVDGLKDYIQIVHEHPDSYHDL